MVCKITENPTKERMSEAVVLSIRDMPCSQCEDTIKNATLICEWRLRGMITN